MQIQVTLNCCLTMWCLIWVLLKLLASYISTTNWSFCMNITNGCGTRLVKRSMHQFGERHIQQCHQQEANIWAILWNGTVTCREKSINLAIFHVEINILNKSTYINEMLRNGRLQCLNKWRLLLIIYNAVNSRMDTLYHGAVNIIPSLADVST